MKKLLIILLCFVLCMTAVLSVVANAANSDDAVTDSLATDAVDANSTPGPDATPDATPDTTPDATPAGPAKATDKPIPNNKGDIQVLDPGNTDAAVNSTGEIIFMGIIVLVCLFFVVEGIFSFFIKKK